MEEKLKEANRISEEVSVVIGTEGTAKLRIME